MGQALYRKYRSKSLSEIVGQDHIITTLQNALKQGMISHAYLFTGPRGVGKTSIARILAHEINQLPYTEESVHVDIIEIDAASNRRIDEIRELRDKVHIAPSSARYKVYIIDEVHMLTREAFNALLKTLEEPPEHVVFILATTEAHKLPETIVSRTQRFSFRPIEAGKAVEHLRAIAKKEKIAIDDEALALMAEHGDGSFRDSISLLDQASSSGRPISADEVRAMLGIAPQAAIEQLYELSQTGTPQTILEHLALLEEQGYEPVHIAKQLSGLIRQRIVDNSVETPNVTELLKHLVEVPASSDPTARLEIVLLEAVLRAGVDSSAPLAPPDEPAGPAEPIEPAKPAGRPKAAAVAPTPKLDKPATMENKPVGNSKAHSGKQLPEAWQSTLTTIKSTYNTLYGVLRMAEPSLDGDTVTLAFQFAFHQKRLADTKNRTIVTDLLHEQLGRPVELVCIVQKNAKPPAPVEISADSADNVPALDTISNIFGAAEVLES